MTLLCMIGRHGSGKSTVGRTLAATGFRHLSVGLLRRLAVANQYPADVPAVLMAAMKREKPGHPLTASTAHKLIRHAVQSGDAVLDGFPACESHLSLLPPETIFVVIWTPAALRKDRLDTRSATTQRIWTPGRPSEREASLPILMRSIRRERRCIFIPNRHDVQTASLLLLNRLQQI